MTSCFICGGPANTQEHVFPKWLQNQFKLWDQRVGLPNKTTIPYRDVRIPCCGTCNNEVLAPIEAKIKNNSASNSEIWKWAAKIHFGLLRKDDFLDWDRRNPGYKIGDVIKNHDPLELERHLVHSIHGEFKTHPDPFGSVFVFNFKAEEPYHFVHHVKPAGLCICLGKTGYVIFVSDTGTLVRQPSVMESYAKHSNDSHLGKMLNFYANGWAHLVRHRTSIPMVMTPKFIAVTGRAKLIEEIPFTDEMYRELWHYVTDNPDNPIVSQEEYEKSNGHA